MQNSVHTFFQDAGTSFPLGMIALPAWFEGGVRDLANTESLAPTLALLILLLLAMLILILRMHVKFKRTTAALNKNKALAQTVGNKLHDITIFQLVYNTTTEKFNFAFIGDGYEQLFHLDRSEVMADAQLALNHVHSEDIPLLRKILGDSKEHLEPVSINIRVVDIDGSPKWLHINAVPRFTDGNLEWDGFMQDISAQKEAEQTIAVESRNFQNLFETIDDFLLVCDMQGLLMHVNPAFENRLEYSHEELSAMNILDLYAESSQADVQRAIEQLQSEPTATCSLPLQMKNGAIILVEMNLFQGIWKHKQAIFGVARDMARHRQAENALRESKKILRLIIDSIPISIFWKDKDSVHLGCNKTFLQECRLESFKDVVGKTPFDLFDEAMASRIVERSQTVIHTNEPLSHYLESYTHPDGDSGLREINLIPLRNEEDHAVGVLGFWRDVTEQNQAEDRLKRTLEDMERFNQLMRGRERRTLELKSEVNELLSELGQARKYRTTSKDMT